MRQAVRGEKELGEVKRVRCGERVSTGARVVQGASERR